MNTVLNDPKEIFYERSYLGQNKELVLRSSYAWLYLLFKRFETNRRSAVLGMLPRGNKLLDIGCGSGELLLNTLSKYRKVFGTDISAIPLISAKKSISNLPKIDSKRIKVIQADADGNLPFRDEYFDTVTIVAVLEHVFDPYKTVNEIRRVLGKNGTLIIQVPNLGFLFRRIAVMLGNLPVTSEDSTGWDGGHLHYFTVSSLKRFLESSGFTLKEVACSGIFAPARSFWVELLGADIIIKAEKK